MTMFYLQTIKNLSESIKQNPEISQEEKQQASELLSKLANLLAFY